MSSTATVDPVRAHVEEALRQVVDSVTAVPCDVVRRTREATGRAAERVYETMTTSIALARSVGELAFGALVGFARSEPSAAGAVRPSAPLLRPAPSPVADTPPVADADRSETSADHLPLEDYESLAASHVVARLVRLSADELAEIREFEEANRGRRTILGKIEQLLNA